MLKDFRKGKKKQGILNFEEWNPAPIKKKKKKRGKCGEGKKSTTTIPKPNATLACLYFPFFLYMLVFPPAKYTGYTTLCPNFALKIYRPFWTFHMNYIF